MALFDRYLIVDWSAAGRPQLGKNSIWMALAEAGDRGSRLVWTKNIATRRAAMSEVEEVFAAGRHEGQRVFAGFDFAFGYPAGAAQKIAGAADWQTLWAKLEFLIEDGEDNSSNRFEVAAQLNRDCLDSGLYWGHPQGRSYNGLTEKMPAIPHSSVGIRREIEKRVKGAKSVWQMAYNGSVGSQSLLGIPALERLRRNPDLSEDIRIWPFETGFDEDLSARCIVAEIYPSLFPIKVHKRLVVDQVQVETLALGFATLDAGDALRPLLARPADLHGEVLRRVVSEEGWIVGAGHSASLPAHKATSDYIHEPAEIYRTSFATIRDEADLSRFGKGMEELAIRLIHACGMVDIADDIVSSPAAFEAGASALQGGAPILCDAEMVRHGIISKLLPANNAVICMLNDERVRPKAAEIENTRSAAQVDLWGDRLGGAVVAIGNAPTALFRLLELLDQGAPKPAIILGFPVGFVGAAESKAALAADSRGVPFIALAGRRGGSAMASAAVNALSGGLGTNV